MAHRAVHILRYLSRVLTSLEAGQASSFVPTALRLAQPGRSASTDAMKAGAAVSAGSCNRSSDAMHTSEGKLCSDQLVDHKSGHLFICFGVTQTSNQLSSVS
jgi:hypothetical protein